MVKTLGSFCFAHRWAVVGAWIALYLVGAGPLFSWLDPVAAWIAPGLVLCFGSLLIARYREEVALGHIRSVAISRTWSTSGRAIAFSGIAIAGAFCALILSADSRVRALGVAGACTALLAALLSLTLTATALGAWGTPRNRRTASTQRTFFDRLAVSIQRRPVVVIVSAGAPLAALALPALSGRPSLVSVIGLIVVGAVLFRMTKSVVVAVTALLTTVLSLGATIGVLTLSAHYGWISPISQDSLVVVLAVEFGLSMVFGTFLVCRIKEYVDAGLPTDFAVRRGFARTATVVLRAAALCILALAWAGFAWGGSVGQISFGLCVAVLIDVILVRGLLVPAAMTLLDTWNWWSPRRHAPLRCGLAAASTGPRQRAHASRPASTSLPLSASARSAVRARSG